MALSLNELRRERKKAFRQMRQKLRVVDTQVEKGERFLKRKLALKRNLIESSDVDEFLVILKAIDLALRALIKLIEALKNIF